jgi:hypothetical protein
MDEQATIESKGQEMSRGKGGGGAGGNPPTQITVTVNPGNPNGKEVCCGFGVAPPQYFKDGAIWLDAGQDYDIKFRIAAANGVNGWATAPFGNQSGLGCPAATQGPTPPFAQGPAGGGPADMTVEVRSPARSLNSYRLNFNNGYYCDPIIVVG